jgi:hypothetical protein
MRINQNTTSILPGIKYTPIFAVAATKFFVHKKPRHGLGFSIKLNCVSSRRSMREPVFFASLPLHPPFGGDDHLNPLRGLFRSKAKKQDIYGGAYNKSMPFSNLDLAVY